jgi:glycosyltransferase involved in cell wall biosynthesis
VAKSGLIVTYYFPPSGGGGVQRWTKFVKYLSRLKWQITVITGSVESGSVMDHTLLDDIPPDVRIIRPDSKITPQSHVRKFLTKIPRGYIQRWISAFFHVTDSRAGWNKEIIPVIDEELNLRQYDVVIFSLPPYSMADLAAQYSTKLEIPVILDMRDPWTSNPYKIYPTPVHRYLDHKREQKTVAGLNYITSAYQSVIDEYQQLSRAKFTWLPNGFDEEDFLKLKPAGFIDKTGLNLAFSGTFYSHLNCPDAVFAAIGELKSQGVRINFHHVGESVYDVQKLAEKYQIRDQVQIWGYQSHLECLQILAGMDAFCIILDKKYHNAEKTIGGKVYEYLRLKKPILAIVPESGEAARLIKDTDAGLVCEENNSGAVAKALRQLISQQAEYRFQNLAHFERAILADKLNKFLEEIDEQRKNL